LSPPSSRGSWRRRLSDRETVHRRISAPGNPEILILQPRRHGDRWWRAPSTVDRPGSLDRAYAGRDGRGPRPGKRLARPERSPLGRRKCNGSRRETLAGPVDVDRDFAGDEQAQEDPERPLDGGLMRGYGCRAVVGADSRVRSRGQRGPLFPVLSTFGATGAEWRSTQSY
jgi:hypothetical protein